MALDVAHAATTLGVRPSRRLSRALAVRGGRDELKRLLRVFYHLPPEFRAALLDRLQARALRRQ